MFLTRRAIVERAQRLGIPLKFHTINKDCALGRGPKIAAHYGRKNQLYDEASADAYIASKICPVTTETAE
jgi:hypothetical protein